eukprot:CAMPEP_0177735068 /NCGR_PEP_ID=MMETSP0484_2-20121128/24577_1 /TAXON_ID=354590 /ORGANISM="Rhodomonas lens, Strain RHODO" /LENGTH=367 /DNA_ID=CAMNT_0019248603 /DNA_START=130 /DNA_END=1233 /DNA_ORIENTATION=+
MGATSSQHSNLIADAESHKRLVIHRRNASSDSVEMPRVLHRRNASSDDIEMPSSPSEKHEVAIVVEASREAEKGRVRGKQKGGVGDIERGIQEEEEDDEEKLHRTAPAQEPPRTVVMLFFAAGMVVLFLILYMLPPLRSVPDGDKFVYKPTTARELEFDKNVLLQYRDLHSERLLLGMCAVYILTQTFCLPGSGTTLNLLAGALYTEFMPYGEFFVAMPFCMLSTAVGALMCWALSFLTARDLVTRAFPEKVRWLRKLVADNRSSAPILFVSLRMSPIVPAYFLNIAAPLTPLPPLHFFFATLAGCAPHAFVTVKTGATLSRLHPGESLLQHNLGQLLIMLLLAILVCFLPSLTKRLHNRIVGQRDA